MTPEEHIKQLSQSNDEFKRWFDNDLPRMVGVEAVNFFTENFQNEGFTDETFEPWKEVKRRENPKRPDRANASLKILTQSGNLGKSIEYTAEPGQVTITSDTKGTGSELDYAAAHNEGTTTAGRNHNVTIPKRQFIGKSATLDKKVMEIMKEGADKILI
jgi:phage gpG-like protein